MNEESLVEELFAALAPMNSRQRSEYLEDQAIADQILRRINELLAAHDEKDSLLT